MVGIIFPTTAEINDIVYSANLIMAGECQSECVILAVAGVRNIDLSEQRSIESSGRPQTVDAKSVVASVLGSPFAMVNNARRNCIEVDVGELVGSYNHCRIVVIERLHHFCKSILVGIYIIGVQLDAEFSCFRMVRSYIPASADSEVIPLGNYVDDSWICDKFLNRFGCAVCRMVVYDDKIEREIGFLRQNRPYGVADSADAVTDRYDSISICTPRFLGST